MTPAPSLPSSLRSLFIDLASRPAANPPPDGMPYLLVSAAETTYGVPFLQVREVRAAQDLSLGGRLPEISDEAVLLNGQTLPLLNLRSFLGTAAPIAPDSRFVIISPGIAEWQHASIAVLVDRVGPVLNLEAGDLETTAAFGPISFAYPLGIGRIRNERRFLINVDRLGPARAHPPAGRHRSPA
jgi:chemotaxis signal transduction protein